MKNYLIDMDGTVCDDIPNEESHRMATASVKPGAVERINALYHEGHRITFFTSRTSEHHSEVTQKWLMENGFRYHDVIYNKPRGGNYVWIDNLDVQAVKYTEGYWTRGEVKQDEFLALHGWTIESESPLEIRHADGSFASGFAAELVIGALS